MATMMTSNALAAMLAMVMRQTCAFSVRIRSSSHWCEDKVAAIVLTSRPKFSNQTGAEPQPEHSDAVSLCAVAVVVQVEDDQCEDKRQPHVLEAVPQYAANSEDESSYDVHGVKGAVGTDELSVIP